MAKKQLNILTKEQIAFLEMISGESYLCRKFYFTGGTPLTAFYLQHRLSEDIDLFSEEEVHLPSIRTFLAKVQKKLKIKTLDYRQFLGLHTFQLFFSAKNILKVDFNYYPFPRIEKGIRYKNLPVDSLLDIAVNKVHTIFTKPRARDYIDIFFILQKEKFKMSDLVLKAKAKFDWHIDPVQIGIRFTQAAEVSDYPRMIKKINHKEWQDFFINEAKKLRPEILRE